MAVMDAVVMGFSRWIAGGRVMGRESDAGFLDF
jgi:hypothetical protein